MEFVKLCVVIWIGMAVAFYLGWERCMEQHHLITQSNVDQPGVPRSE